MVHYLENCWYAAAHADDVGERPLERRLLDRDVVIFRDEAGAAAILEDRCPHRFAPLSSGQVVGSTIQCPYHGLRFDRTGACVHNPHARNGAAPKAAAVRSWPVMEKYGIVWIWPGDASLADAAALPPVEFLERPDVYRTVKGLLHVRANYELVVDNLLDLSHTAYIHPQFVGGRYSPEQLSAATTQRLERRARSLVNHRMRSGLAAPAATQALFGFGSETPVHSDTTMTWFPPAMLHFTAGSWVIDTPREDGAHLPQLHFITPETEFSSHYFFIGGRNRRRDDPEVDQALLDFFDLAFARQDEPMIAKVQQRMGRVSDINDLRPILLATDAAAISARRMLAKLIAQERCDSELPAQSDH